MNERLQSQHLVARLIVRPSDSSLMQQDDDSTDDFVYDPIKAGSRDGKGVVPHDRGLIRALNAKYSPWKDPKIQGRAEKTLFVGRLSFTTTDESLRDRFERFGRIRRLRLVRDIVTLESKGYAFIEYEHSSDCRAAYQRMHRAIIDGATILVDIERSRVMKGWKPRRLGGGLGGRKESGQMRFGGRDCPFRRYYHK